MKRTNGVLRITGIGRPTAAPARRSARPRSTVYRQGHTIKVCIFTIKVCISWRGGAARKPPTQREAGLLDLPKTVQGGLANDGGRQSNAKVEWLPMTNSTALTHLARVPVLCLTREVRLGDEITFPYSPNSQYSAAIDYAKIPESST